MYGDGEPSPDPIVPEGADQASTSGSSVEALSKQAHDNPAFVENATASRSHEEELQSLDARENLTPEVPPFIPLQNDSGWVPMAFSPMIFPGNPELWSGTAGMSSNGVETFPPGVMPLGAFPTGISPTGTSNGISIPQCLPVLFPVQMPLFLPSPPPNQAGQNAGFYPFSHMVPFYGLPGMAAGLNFSEPMNVPMAPERNLSGAPAGQHLADAGRGPPAVAVPLGRIGPVQLNEMPAVAQGEAPDQRRVVRRYQTSSLAPLLRWLAERAQQFMTPPHHHAQPQPDAHRARGPDAQAREVPGAEPANPAAEERAGA